MKEGKICCQNLLYRQIPHLLHVPVLTTRDSWKAVSLPNPALASDMSTTTAILLPRILPNIWSIEDSP